MKNIRFTYLLLICLIYLNAILLSGCGDNENPAAHDNNNKQPVGISSGDFLSGMNYDQLTVEVQYAAGYAPSADVLNHLKNFIGDLLNKPGGITIVTQEIATPGKSTYSISDIKAIEDNNRTLFTENKMIAAYFFFADGGYSEDTDNAKVLGVAYRNGSMAIFQKTIQSYSGSLGQPSTFLLTATVAEHEFGHILGLVNNGTSMEVQHQDTAHGKHCTVDACLMFWTAETGQAIDNLLGLSSPPPLDAQCKADLKANGGK